MTESDMPNAADAANDYVNLVEIGLNIEALIQVINDIEALVAHLRGMDGIDTATLDEIAKRNASQLAMMEHYLREINKLR